MAEGLSMTDGIASRPILNAKSFPQNLGHRVMLAADLAGLYGVLTGSSMSR